MPTENISIKSIAPHAEYVTSNMCHSCGEGYADFRAGISFADARQRLCDLGYEYISRGPVLWMMRVMKLDSFFLKHSSCESVPSWVYKEEETEPETF
jgi:hypothetical protein